MEDQEEWKQIRRGWYLGSSSFRDMLLDRLAVVGVRSAQTGDRDQGLAPREEAGALRRIKIINPLCVRDPAIRVFRRQPEIASSAGFEWGSMVRDPQVEGQ
ncbi:MAG: hypothetical protein O2901_15420 [Verrucomicrobia bacterium]|nr:hypothetical protein [Verrucomicrobiota bacterium]